MICKRVASERLWFVQKSHIILLESCVQESVFTQLWKRVFFRIVQESVFFVTEVATEGDKLFFGTWFTSQSFLNPMFTVFFLNPMFPLVSLRCLWSKVLLTCIAVSLTCSLKYSLMQFVYFVFSMLFNVLPIEFSCCSDCRLIYFETLCLWPGLIYTKEQVSSDIFGTFIILWYMVLFKHIGSSLKVYLQ